MKEIKLFENADFGTVRTITVDDGTVLYCASDITKLLGYKNSSKAISDHCRSDALTIRNSITDRLGRTQEATFIAKSNVIRLITHSKLPNAQRIEKWLFEEIAPRAMEGELISKEKVYGMFNNPDAMLQLVTNWKIDRERADALEKENDRLKPKAVLGAAIESTKTDINVADLSLILQQVPGGTWKGGRNTLHKRLMQDGYTRRNRNGDIVPTQKAQQLGVLRVAESHRLGSGGTVCTDFTTMVTGKGQTYFTNRYAGVEQSEQLGIGVWS